MPGAVLADTRTAGSASPGRDPSRALRSTPGAKLRVPDASRQPPSPLSLAAASGSPFSQQIAHCGSLQLRVFLLLALLPFLRQAWSFWEEQQLLPGWVVWAPVGSHRGAAAPKGGWDGLLWAATEVSGLPSNSRLARLHPCGDGVTGTGSCGTGARSRGWESSNCNPGGFHAASEMDLRQLLEIVPVGTAPPAPGPLFAYLEP